MKDRVNIRKTLISLLASMLLLLVTSSYSQQTDNLAEGFESGSSYTPSASEVGDGSNITGNVFPSDAPSSLLFDNGPLVNSTGTGTGGADESIIQAPLTSYGWNFNKVFFNRMADDFTVSGNAWNVSSVEFYGYQTNSPITSTFTAGYLRILNEVPGAPGTSVVWGDTTTNRMTSTSFTNIYRTNAVNGGVARPIMKIVVNTPGLTLPAGTYYVDFSAAGSLASGPWCPPVTINNTPVTGNGLVYGGTAAGYQPLTGGAQYAQGVPFKINGTQILPLQSVPRSMVIMEIGTGTWNTYCPGAAMGAADLLAGGSKVAVIANHNGDSYANTYSNSRNAYYGINGYPAAIFDGNQATVGGSHSNTMYPSYLPKYNSAIAITSPVSINMAVSNTGLNYTVIVTLIKTDTLTSNSLKLFFALTQSNIALAWQGQTQLHHVNQLMVPDQNGTTISFSSNNTQVVTLDFTIPSSFPLEDCEMITWLQKNDAGQGTIPGSGSPALKRWTTVQGIKRAVIDLNPAFTASSTNINPGNTVAFTNNTSGGYIGTPETYIWHFPGATPETSTAKNPVVTYGNPGYFNVILIVSRGGQVDTLTKAAYIQVAGSAPHFLPIWTGNPLYPMSITVTQALLDGANLIAGDEIGVFDGTVCVGAYKLTTPINPVSPPFITVSKDDPATTPIDGYSEGNTIVYKLWKNSTNLEVSNVTHAFPYAPSFVFETFLQSETAVVTLSGISTVTQNTPLLAGWNMISFNAQPANMNLLNILQPLVSSGNLVKVIDEAGLIIQNFPWGWVNNIGNMAVTEGYYIKVAAACTLSVNGAPILEPTAIPLITGWNLMGYPGQTAQNALTALQPLINAGILLKVIDEAGNIIQYFPWGWVNNIGNFKPGEGYYIKVLSACSVTISNLKDALEDPIPAARLVHFTLPVQGNPYQPMSLGLSLNSEFCKNIAPGSEIGVFDGNLCVGAFSFDGTRVSNVVITVYADDPESPELEGFTEAGSISFKFWDQGSFKEVNPDVIHLSGDKVFSRLGTFVGELKYLPSDKSSGDQSLAWLGNNYPNPFSGMTEVEFKVFEPCTVVLTVLSPQGMAVKEVVNSFYQPGFYKTRIEAQFLSPGIWFYRLEATTKGLRFDQTRKMLVD